MDINVTFDNGRWITDPSPAIVEKGTTVRWVFRSQGQRSRALTWTVRFSEQVPFGAENALLEATTSNAKDRPDAQLVTSYLEQLGFAEDASLSHRGATEPQIADSPGEYKYDLLVQDAFTGERISEDDPLLIVVRRATGIFDFYTF